VKGDILLFELLHLIEIGFLSVVIEAAPPVSEDIAGEERRDSGKTEESPDSLFVILGEEEDIDIFLIRIPDRHFLFLIETIGSGVIEESDAVPGTDADAGIAIG
jgi:hypothetical protein